MRYTNEQKQFIFSKYNEGFSPKEIHEKYIEKFKEDRTLSSLRCFLSKNNLTGNNKNNNIYKNPRYNQLSMDDIKEICDLYVSGLTTTSLSTKYKKSRAAITKILTDHNVKIRKGGTFAKIENENFFETINTEEKAYILGYLLTDGYVIDRRKEGRSPEWGISLNEKDEYILEFIKNTIGIDKKIITVDVFSKKDHKLIGHTKTLTVTSKKMFDDLAKYGIVPRKSHKISMPQNIPENLLNHFVRGVFDGDGCICISKRVTTIQFAGNDLFLESLQKLFLEKLNIPEHTINEYKHISKTDKVTKNFVFSFAAKNDVYNLYKYMYKNASIFLTRKKEKFELFNNKNNFKNI